MSVTLLGHVAPLLDKQPAEHRPYPSHALPHRFASPISRATRQCSVGVNRGARLPGCGQAGVDNERAEFTHPSRADLLLDPRALPGLGGRSDVSLARRPPAPLPSALPDGLGDGRRDHAAATPLKLLEPPLQDLLRHWDGGLCPPLSLSARPPSLDVGEQGAS